MTKICEIAPPESGLAKIEDTTASFGLYRSYLVFLEHYSEVSDRIET
ncbi:hypothetical protein [Paenibacillus odorifer]|nr:hypothetical protein [Paenibacillus odorifer]